MSDQEIARAYEARLPLLDAVAETLEQKAKDALDGVPHIDRIQFRVKSTKSFVVKANQQKEDSTPKYSTPLSEIEDQVAGRILTFFRSDIEVVKNLIEEWFGSVEHQAKEPSRSDAFGYVSDHYICVIQSHLLPSGWVEIDDMPTTFELQIRTLFMHAWAEPEHLIDYKGADLSPEIQRELAWAAASAWGADRILDEIAVKTGQMDA